MKKYYFTIASILVLAIGTTSCSNEENKTQNEIAARPTVPVLDGEVRIGTQIWMAKNLNVSRYRNGDLIPQVTDQTQWANLTTGAWCYYANNSANGTIYGKLYNWYAVNDPRGLAPAGFHVASAAEWDILINFLGGPSIAGEKLKATRLWATPNTATNSSGFTALPGGGRSSEMGFASMTVYGDWWASTETGFPETSAGNARQYYMTFINSLVVKSFNYHKQGMSVRCVKD